MQIGMLGPLEVRADGGGLTDVPGSRLRGLLVALALRPGHVVPKATLIDWIWGQEPPADATNALQRLVSRLRKALGDGVIEGRPDGYRLRAQPDAVDAVRFERLLIAGQASTADDALRARLLREALGLWRGGALQDIGLPDSAALDAAAGRLEGLRLTAAEERASAEIALGRGAELIGELTDLVAAYPVRERLAAALMRALVAAGRDSEALLVYQRAREALADALGVDPSPELAALHVALLRGELPRGEPGRGEPGRREKTRETNLRAELTSFVGRDADVAAVRELIAASRLTTVTGPGGAGKTRLATETARTLLDDFPDGVWLVELAPIGAERSGPEGNQEGGKGGQGGGRSVAQAALDALGLRDALLGDAPSAEPADRLIAAVRERKALLILDNCEHVIESAAVLAHRLLGECRRLRILATSREPFGITGEALWQVEPLALPAEGPEGSAAPGEIESAPAVRLLRDRAGAVRRDLPSDARALATMARVCRSLDGMPLAIELAAARLRTMSMDQLASRLDDRFRLLTGGSRTALPRHRTLRAVVDWSWELLTDAERAVLRRLSVFSGGASLEAAERVCADDAFRADGGANGAAVEREHVLDLLTALTDKSLLLNDDDGVPRYRMSGTIREYAAQRLAAAGEADLTRRAHLACFTELAETAEPHLRRAEQLTWLATLQAEHDNIAAAMRGALAAGEAQAAMRLAAGAGWYWWLGGHKTEGREFLTAAAGVPGEASDDARAMVYGLLVQFTSGGRGDERQAATWIREAYRFSRGSRLRHPAPRVVVALERMLRAPDAYLTAFEPLLDDEDPWVRALARLHMGKARIALGQGGRDDRDDRDSRGGRDADEYLETALAEFRALGERFGISFALTELADRVATRGEFADACEHYERAIAVVTEAGATEDIISMRSRQAQLYWLAGDEAASAAAVAEAQRHAERVSWPDALAELALAKAELARWSGDPAEARRHLGAAASLLGDEAERAKIDVETHDLLGYISDDLGEATAHRAAACQAAASAGHPRAIAKVLVGIADLALRRGEHEQAARLLAASDAVRGLPDRSSPDAGRIERAARSRLGDTRFAEAALEGTRADWAQLAEATLAP